MCRSVVCETHQTLTRAENEANLAGIVEAKEEDLGVLVGETEVGQSVPEPREEPAHLRSQQQQQQLIALRKATGVSRTRSKS